MGFFNRIIGFIRTTLPTRDVAALTCDLAEPALQLHTTDAAAKSYFGGLPEAPADFAWPVYHGRPLTLLATLCLDELAGARQFSWLPAKGRLLFFYDAVAQPWGFDPEESEGWRVLFIDGDGTSLAEVQPPEELSEDYILPRYTIGLRAVNTFPSWEREAAARLRLNDAELDLYSDIRFNVYNGSPHHQIGGYPDPLQNDRMELECQLVSNGLYCGDNSCFESERALAMRKDAADWRLLLQMDSDDELAVMWGDAGLLYFWIKESDAKEGRFDKAWLVLQCS